jgi:2-phosphoglycerate kinase
MITNLRRHNPKKFNRKFRKRKQLNVHNITLEQFKEHFSNLMNIQDNNIDRNNEPNSQDNVFYKTAI